MVTVSVAALTVVVMDGILGRGGDSDTGRGECGAAEVFMVIGGGSSDHFRDDGGNGGSDDNGGSWWLV